MVLLAGLELYGHAVLPHRRTQAAIRTAVELNAREGVPRDSLQPCTLRKDQALWIEAVGSDGTEAFEGLVNFVPEVIAGERDMAPRQRGNLARTNETAILYA